ncbi:Glycosyltransferase, DXD sugar-binding motif protein [Pleurostoma richardsiae]|uniref:Glycosyltransferase, DXD sugar-binding motif protein n=1 Tax=Pleurostoma richardsiae TaxID=41990 RepID=A0AA38VKT6_9PEZI|nr:Glycosyltransferase, DXD sugar-binding motif protein [Pleurostoma richardsiae]
MSTAVPSWASMRPVGQRLAKYADDLGLPRWPTQYASRSRSMRLLLTAILALLILHSVMWHTNLPISSPEAEAEAVSTLQQLFPEIMMSSNTTAARLPHIPPKIWQIFLDFTPSAISMPYVHSWITKSPSHSYTVLDSAGALALVVKLASTPGRSHMLPLFYAMSRRVLRADFLRYLILALEGGVYSDADTQMVRPLHEWVPEEFRASARLVVGLEADRSPPIPGTTYEVQFCQWTLAGAAGHPTFWTMAERILRRVEARPFESPPRAVEYSDADVLDVTGPAGWTEVVYEHLSMVTGTSVTWRNLTGIREPRLLGDTVVLPIDGFATGVPHSNASRTDTEQTMVKHLFVGAWRDGHG